MHKKQGPSRKESKMILIVGIKSRNGPGARGGRGGKTGKRSMEGGALDAEWTTKTSATPACNRAEGAILPEGSGIVYRRKREQRYDA